jgi:hypothetical protein
MGKCYKHLSLAEPCSRRLEIRAALTRDRNQLAQDLDGLTGEGDDSRGSGTLLELFG